MPTSQHLAANAYFAGGTPALSIVSTLHAPGELGQVVTFNGVRYRCVKLAAVTIAVGETLVWSDRTNWIVTNVSANVSPCAGIAINAATSGTYTWVALRGKVDVKYLDSPAVAPDTVGKAAVMSGTNGRADCVTSATMVEIIGRTLAAQDGTSKLASTQVNIFDGES